MCDQDHFDDDKLEYEAQGLVTRRQFGVLLGAGIAMALPQVANAVAVVEAEVTITTPDGTCDAYFVHPSTGTAPGVIVWPDIFGLRGSMRQMGRRLAESGYSVLVVNPFYRTQKAPTAVKGAATPIAEVMPLARTLNEQTHMTDARAFVAWLDQQPSVARNRRMGTQGYCMGGPMAFPIAEDDDQKEPQAKDALRAAFKAAGRPAEVEVYAGARHGWCVPGSPVYNAEAAERAWSALLALYRRRLT